MEGREDQLSLVFSLGLALPVSEARSRKGRHSVSRSQCLGSRETVFLRSSWRQRHRGGEDGEEGRLLLGR